MPFDPKASYELCIEDTLAPKSPLKDATKVRCTISDAKRSHDKVPIFVSPTRDSMAELAISGVAPELKHHGKHTINKCLGLDGPHAERLTQARNADDLFLKQNAEYQKWVESQRGYEPKMYWSEDLQTQFSKTLVADGPESFLARISLKAQFGMNEFYTGDGFTKYNSAIFSEPQNIPHTSGVLEFFLWNPSKSSKADLAKNNVLRVIPV
jgi:hypothetical protein